MSRRLMKIKYPHDERLVGRLCTCLDMCCMPHVVHDDYNCFTIFIDRGRCTWNQVINEVNRVKSVKFRYESNMWIKGGVVYEQIPIK